MGMLLSMPRADPLIEEGARLFRDRPKDEVVPLYKRLGNRPNPFKIQQEAAMALAQTANHGVGAAGAQVNQQQAPAVPDDGVGAVPFLVPAPGEGDANGDREEGEAAGARASGVARGLEADAVPTADALSVVVDQAAAETWQEAEARGCSSPSGESAAGSESSTFAGSFAVAMRTKRKESAGSEQEFDLALESQGSGSPSTTKSTDQLHRKTGQEAGEALDERQTPSTPSHSSGSGSQVDHPLVPRPPSTPKPSSSFHVDHPLVPRPPAAPKPSSSFKARSAHLLEGA